MLQVQQHDWGSFGIALAVIVSSFVTYMQRRSDVAKSVAATTQVATTLAQTARDSALATNEVATTLAKTSGETKGKLEEIHTIVNSHSAAQEKKIDDLREEVRVLQNAQAERLSADVSLKIKGLEEQVAKLNASLKKNGSTN
jgi:hypothetical protein